MQQYDDVLIEGATNQEYGIVEGDIELVPVVKNNYNGSIYTYILDLIRVNDSAH
jgi:hypothetical protein